MPNYVEETNPSTDLRGGWQRKSKRGLGQGQVQIVGRCGYDPQMLIPNTLFQAGRIVIGSGFVAAPEAVGQSWIGDAANADGGIMARAFGGRDIALGAATLIAARDPKILAPLLALGVMVDSIDCAATLAAGDKIPDRARYVSAGLAAGAAINGFRLFVRARGGSASA